MKYLSDKEVDYLFRDTVVTWGGSHLNYMNVSEANKSMCVTANFTKGVLYNVLFEKIGELNA